MWILFDPILWHSFSLNVLYFEIRALGWAASSNATFFNQSECLSSGEGQIKGEIIS